METTQPMIFSEEENAREAYLSQQILDSKHKANLLGWFKKYQKALNIQWFCRKISFFSFWYSTPQFVY